MLAERSEIDSFIDGYVFMMRVRAAMYHHYSWELAVVVANRSRNENTTVVLVSWHESRDILLVSIGYSDFQILKASNFNIYAQTSS